VRLAGERALDRLAAPWSIGPADWFDDVERLRALFARVAGADPDGVAIVPSTSYGLAVAAANTEAAPGDRVVLLAGDFPSNVHTWTAWAERAGAEVVTVERADHGQADSGWTEPAVDCLDERVRVVSVPSVHWVDGSVVDLEQVARRAREVGALLVVDATQSLGAMPLDLAAVRPDYLVTAGYKWLLGPLGTSYLYVAPEHRDGRPLEENWANRAGAEDFEKAAPITGERGAARTGAQDGEGAPLRERAYRPGARRFDVGQRSNFVLVPMAIAALEQVLDWGIEEIAAALEPVTARIEEQARAIGFEPTAARLRAPHMLGIGLPEEAARRWTSQNVHVEILGSVLRVSPHLHVTDSDLESLFAELRRIDS
jgi:selenocysteine lyase/cysteine desulfurase